MTHPAGPDDAKESVESTPSVDTETVADAGSEGPPEMTAAQGTDADHSGFDETIAESIVPSADRIDSTLAAGDVPPVAELSAGGDSATIADSSVARSRPARVVAADTPDADVLSARPHSASEIVERIQNFTVEKQLGSGAMGTVYRARDRRNGREVALKRLFQIDSVKVALFKSEFRELADLAHPNLATLYELVSDGETWFITMELIHGFNFAWYVRLGPHADMEAAAEARSTVPVAREYRLRSAMGQLVHGLWALHEAGKVHRDIKPANVMVTADGCVKLLDFGLIANMQMSTDAEEPGLYGTVPYISPEQAGGAAASPASDCYAVGVMLYELLAGRAPFRGKPAEVLTLKQFKDPPAPSTIGTEISDDLDQLCMDMLNRDPNKRPTSAELLQRLNVRDPQPAGVLRQESTEDRMAFVGRYEQMNELLDSFRELSEGKTQLVLVQGKSGFGKSAMVRRFTDRARASGAIVLTGRCYERESVPFKAWDSLVDGLALHLRSLPEGDAATVIPERVASLLHVFPVLGRVTALTSAARGQFIPDDQHELRSQAFGALREILARIGNRQPLVLFIDDLQWGDADSADVLVDMLRPPDVPTLLVVGTIRSEDVESSEFLKSLDEYCGKVADPPQRRTVTVEALTRDESIDLALRLLRDVDDEAQTLAGRIADEAAGNPFFVEELVRSYRETGSRADSSRHTGDQRVRLDEVLWERISRLPEPTRRLLELIAVKGTPIDEQLAYEVAATDGQGPDLLAQLRSALLVRAVRGGAGGRVACYHDRIRETIVAHLPRDLRVQHHLRLAEEIERRARLDADQLIAALEFAATGTVTVAGEGTITHGEIDEQQRFDVAVHYDAAGDSERALPFAYGAATRAHKEYSLESAEVQYRIAERGAVSADAPVRYHLAMSLGDVLMLRGRYDAARERFETARSLAKTRLNRMDVLARLAELTFKHGDPSEPVNLYEEALETGGFPIPPRNKARRTLQVLRFALSQATHSLLPSVFPRQRQRELERIDALRLRCLHGATLPYFFTQGPLAGFWAHLQELNIAETCPASSELGQAYARHVFLLNIMGWRKRARQYADRSLQIRRDLGHRWGIGQTLSYQGATSLADGDLSEAVPKLRKAIAIFEETGDWFENNLAGMLLSIALFRIDQLPEAAAQAERVYWSGVNIGDFQIAGISLAAWAMATDGNVPPEILEKELKRPRDENDQFALTLIRCAEGICMLSAGEFEHAIQALEHADGSRRQTGVNTLASAPVPGWLTHALRRFATSQPDGSRERRQLLRRTRKALRIARKMGRRFPLIAPFSLREAGEVELLSGNHAGAIRLFEQSLDVAETTGGKLEYRLTSERLAALKS